MHKSIVIIGAGPSGLLLAQMLSNRGIDCIILENRNEPFLRKQDRGGWLEHSLVETLKAEIFPNNLENQGIPIKQIDFKIENTTYSIAFAKEKNQSIIYDQKNLVADLLQGLKENEIPIIFEAKAQRYEGLENEKIRIVYTLDGQIYEMTCDYVIGCDGFRGISRRSIPRDLRKEYKEELPLAWLEWIVDGNALSKHPVIAYHKHGFAMQSRNANGQTRYYLQVERGMEMDDLPPTDEIWNEIESRLGTKVKRGKMLNLKLDYMRSFYTNLMQHGRLFIAGDAAHQVPRLGSKGINMALKDAARLAQAFNGFYKKKDPGLLKKYTKQSLEINLKTIDYTNQLNRLFHKKTASDLEEKLKQLLTNKSQKTKLIKFFIG